MRNPDYVCSVLQCKAQAVGKSLCAKHYARQRRWGDAYSLKHIPIPVQVCEQCNDSFKTSQRKQRFCSRQCLSTAKSPKPCLIVGCPKLADTRKGGSRGHCNRHVHMLHLIEAVCVDCGRRRMTRNYIHSPRCGQCASKEVSNRLEIKIAASRRAREQVLAQGGITNAQKFPAGNAHPHWKGGIAKTAQKGRYTKEYRSWRRSVLERDKFTCQICHVCGLGLHVDHIKPYSTYPELRLDLSNGRTLCVKCHRQTDTYGHKSIGRAA